MQQQAAVRVPRSVLERYVGDYVDTRFKVGTTSAIVEFVVDEAGVMQVLGSGFQQSLARLTSKR